MLKKLLPPALAALCALSMAALDRWVPLATLVAEPYRKAGGLAIALGVLAAAAARLQFARARTNIYTFDEPGALLTGGVFRLSRHPMYLGMTLVLAGLAWWLGSAAPWAGVLGFALAADRWYMPFEERWLREKFGPAYADYARRTRRWL